MQLNATLAPGREANKAGEQAGCAVVNWPKGEVEGRKQKAESRKQKAESRKPRPWEEAPAFVSAQGFFK
jgi:hypothetical protein